MKTDKFLGMPMQPLGKWAAGLAVFYILISILVALSVLPFSGFLLTVIGVIAGVLGLIASIRDRERSWLVWLSILILLYALFWIGGELLYPH